MALRLLPHKTLAPQGVRRKEMKRLPLPHFWLLCGLAALLFLAACERPIPREEGTVVPTSQDAIPAATLPVTTPGAHD